MVVALLPMSAWANEGGENKELDIPEIVLEHLADSYEWHIASYQGSHISIPLPIIVRSENTGEWHFCTAHSLPEPFFFSEEHHGKIYERVGGEEVRPLDLSITKSVLQIWIVVAVLIIIFLSCARWYKKHDAKSEAPKGFVGAMEMIVMTIHDDLIKSSIGEKHYKPYAPYLLTVFFFILTCNLIGLIPVFPGGANVTGNINITFFLAIQQGVLEGDLLARGASVPEGLSRSGNATHRTVRSLHKAFRSDDPSFCQHDGWSRCDIVIYVCDLPRLVDGCRIRLRT